MHDFPPSRHRLVLIASVAAVAIIAFSLGRFAGSRPPGPSSTTTPEPRPADTVKVSDKALALMNITLERVSNGNVSEIITAPGVVSTAVNSDAIVTAHAAGTISKISKRLGESVSAGETLALVTSREAAALAAEKRAAEAKATLARSIVKRERALFEQKVTPRQDLEAAEAQLEAADAEAARARLAADASHVSGNGQSLAVVSPIAGRVTSARAALGAYVEPDAELFRVADPRFVVIEVSVPPSDVVRVHQGDPAQVITATGAALTATVTSLTPTIDARSGSATVTLTLGNGQTPPVPGEFVRARITPRTQSDTELVVPEEAIQTLDNREVVFVKQANGFRIRPVTVGSRGGGRVAIRAGLSSGEVIASKNAFLLKAEVSKSTEEEE